ncbi:16S rRNA (guanine(966)-N(2))-methyltransferase RsmD [candidate division WOR-3 bacterium JGI_Cruoil_03_44_89]|mgnify:CR=1 FL=1|uniref:16S rRNA (Guanine(966)-N(2))-methyltransferase RsmD n=1 Tax=candidate division WOR-3 bacterium JGI_Cruoil_03_44_89 TaxID=1973748 RepID=A0A235BRG4_UNCW3|nr:MAG: 16S rRNA (guanine(966)-N(2))-methyltransferase RsmD [candidate division WOR-3 bacterium JGI_Cruoil_03_44_89]
MRIIGGSHKGYEIKMPRQIRPTSGLVRESIFNVIGDVILGARVLDLFCGSGALGLEALSRGARSVTFVEKDRRVTRVLIENIKNLGCSDFNVINTDAMRLSVANTYDIIFADPPYDRGYTERIIKKFEKFVNILVIEHSVREELDVGETRRYGDTLVTYIWNL